MALVGENASGGRWVPSDLCPSVWPPGRPASLCPSPSVRRGSPSPSQNPHCPQLPEGGRSSVRSRTKPPHTGSGPGKHPAGGGARARGAQRPPGRGGAHAGPLRAGGTRGRGRGQEASRGPGRPARPRDVARLPGISPRGPGPLLPALLLPSPRASPPRRGRHFSLAARSPAGSWSQPPSPPSYSPPSFSDPLPHPPVSFLPPLSPLVLRSRSSPSLRPFFSSLSPPPPASLSFSRFPCLPFSLCFSPRLPLGFPLPPPSLRVSSPPHPCPPSSLAPLPLHPSQPRRSQLPSQPPEPEPPPPALAAGPARSAPRGAPYSAPRPRGSLG